MGAGTIHSHSAVTEWNGQRYLKDNKSEAGRRTLPLAEVVADALRAHRERQEVQRAAFGEKWRDNDFVFPNPDGGARRPDTPSKQFSRKIARLGLPHVRLYDLRRLAITLVLTETRDLTPRAPTPGTRRSGSPRTPMATCYALSAVRRWTRSPGGSWIPWLQVGCHRPI